MKLYHWLQIPWRETKDKKVSYYEKIFSTNQAVVQFTFFNRERERIQESNLFNVSILLIQVR